MCRYHFMYFDLVSGGFILFPFLNWKGYHRFFDFVSKVVKIAVWIVKCAILRNPPHKSISWSQVGSELNNLRNWWEHTGWATFSGVDQPVFEKTTKNCPKNLNSLIRPVFQLFTLWSGYCLPSIWLRCSFSVLVACHLCFIWLSSMICLIKLLLPGVRWLGGFVHALYPASGLQPVGVWCLVVGTEKKTL